MAKLFVKRLFSPLFCGLLVAVIFTACNPTKYVPKGKQLLTKNKIELNNKAVNNSTVKNVIRQKPNKKVGIPATNVVLWRPYLMLYNWGNPEKDKGFSHWLTEIGEPPTIVDSSLTFSSARQLGQYYFNTGYFLNEVEFTMEWKKDSSRAEVTYKIYSGPQYYFNKVEYIISSPGIREIVNEVKVHSKLKADQPYSTDALEKERNRLVSLLRNSGYYAFPKNLVRFEADTSVGDHHVNVKLIVGDKPAMIGDSIFYIEHVPYIINNIYIDPNYNFSEAKSLGVDTSFYRGLSIIEKNPPKYKSSFLESQIHFKNGELYNEKNVKESYSHLTGNRVFQIAEISFQNVEGDTTNALDAKIKVQPTLKRTFSAELEGTNTSGNYGIAGVLTWATRNIFRGGEILDFSIRGGLEAQVNVNDNNNIFNTQEIGAEVGINFPRFALIGRLNQKVPKRMQPKSRIYTSYSYQTRVEFERSIFAVGLLYNWKESITKTHQINLLEINYVILPRIDQSYLESLEFKTGFQNNLITAFRYTFVFDNKKKTSGRAHSFFRGSIEPSGNILSLINGEGNFDQDSTGQYLVLGVPFAQYIKLDLDFRRYINLTNEHQVATRVFLGTTFNYGNSPYLPPFEKSFLAGGSNDIRGWNAYRLGPGNFPKYLYSIGSTSYAAVAPIKIMANIEYRFPIIKSFRGAFFFDTGNIWLWDREYKTTSSGQIDEALVEHGIFKFESFWKQLATNTGVGLRYDFGFFAFRLDLGMKIWDPTEPVNQRYVLNGLKWSTITYNIALGYPF